MWVCGRSKMEKKRLGDICEIVTGATPKTNIKEFWDGDINWITPAELTEDTYIINESLRKITTEGVEKTGLKSFPKGTVILSSRAPIGKVAIAGCEMYCNQGFKNLVCSKQINNRFLYWYLKGHKEYLNSLGRGATFKEISKAIVENIEICLPTLEKQEKYADILEQCNGIIQIKKGQLRKLDTLVKSRFVELFGDPVINSRGWKKALIGDDCFVTKLAGFEYTQYINYEDSGDVVMVKAQNVKNGKLNRKELSFVSNEVSDSLPRSQLAPRDVVMTYVGANIGDVAIIDNEYKYHLAPNVAKIRPDSERYNSIYFMYMLMLLNAYIVKNSADTAKAALGMERIRKLNVFVPPMELQNQFADFVTFIDKSKSKIQKSLEETQLLFDSLMQKYFG